MISYSLTELREKFLNFFEKKDHLKMPSSSLIPKNDKSLLLINSGMAPLKPYFTRQEKPKKLKVTTCQKCIRTGDIDNVGKTNRHATFFEMLGNFSFGDYFKEDAIALAWEFIKYELGMPLDKIYISVYDQDEEAFKIWNEKIGIEKDRIYKLGKEDNFWEVGVGPCGPCSEIYFDKGSEYGCDSKDCGPGCDHCERYIEFWNLVFTQFYLNDDGSYSNLSNPNIDTGMGLERIASIIQNTDSIFDIDVMKTLINELCKLSKVDYNQSERLNISIRIITDHIRSITFMASDGILPSNYGRGYIERRLLRRAVRHAKILGINEPFLRILAKKVIDVFGSYYEELLDNEEHILKVIDTEERRFYETLSQGMNILREYINDIKSSGLTSLDGDSVFKLYDTFGFPFELTKEILDEQSIGIDEDLFKKRMQEQKTRARSARSKNNYSGTDESIYDSLTNFESTVFKGYDCYSLNTNILAIISDNTMTDTAKQNSKIVIFLDKTPFYAESGGQKGDIGIIQTKTGKADIIDCIKINGNRYAHIGSVTKGYIKCAQEATAHIDIDNRLSTARNHSATHLLQQALKDILGTHVRQSGSMVNAKKLRFDFSHFNPLSRYELNKVEDIINAKILQSLDIYVTIKDIEQAKKDGAIALFGEKYNDDVRVISIGDYSLELCGGTHVKNSANISMIKILSETGVSSGVRRIEAITGNEAMIYYKNKEKLLNDLTYNLKVSENELQSKISSVLDENIKLKERIEKQKSQELNLRIDSILNNVKDKIVIKEKFKNIGKKELRSIADKLKSSLDSYFIIIANETENKADLLIEISTDLVSKGAHAGNIVKDLSRHVKCGGGGRNNMAQAGGIALVDLEESMNISEKFLMQQLS